MPLEWQRLEAGDGADVLAELRAFRDPVLGDALVPLLEGDPQFQARQVRADTPVRTGAEGEVPVGPAVRDEGVRVGELLGIATGGRVRRIEIAARRGTSTRNVTAAPFLGGTPHFSSSMRCSQVFPLFCVLATFHCCPSTMINSPVSPTCPPISA